MKRRWRPERKAWRQALGLILLTAATVNLIGLAGMVADALLHGRLP
jgi:hypothetical protein